MTEKFDPAIIEAEENALIDCQFLLQEMMTEKNVTPSQLAELTGLSKSRISQIMSPEANPTIKTFARLFHALGEDVCLARKTPVTFEEQLRGARQRHHISKWNWNKSDDSKVRVDDRLVAVVKDTAASNDNYGDRFLMIESELTLDEAA